MIGNRGVVVEGRIGEGESVEGGREGDMKGGCKREGIVERR